MTIENIKNGTQLIMKIAGRLDTSTSPQLEAQLQEFPADMQELLLDFEALEYISSAGLRVLLAAQKKINARKGSMKILHANENIMEVFGITGFADILTIE